MTVVLTILDEEFLMQIKNAKYLVTAVKPEQYPVHQISEIALVGRSNVGKSSLINTLVNHKGLARQSATPGKTREINFFSVNDTLILVDLPGYGYAKVSKTAKLAWGGMIETYLNTRQQLKLIIMLVDIRHKPTNDDQLMYDWLSAQAVPKLVVATKLDKISKNQVEGRLKEIRTTLGMTEMEALIPVSAETKIGRDEIWNHINQYLNR